MGSAGEYATGVEAFRLNTEADRAQAELNMRNQIRSAFAMGGAEAVFRAFPSTDPLVLDKLLDTFGRNVTESERTASTVETIANGLKARGLIPRI
jgi:hypothetical protein